MKYEDLLSNIIRIKEKQMEEKRNNNKKRDELNE